MGRPNFIGSSLLEGGYGSSFGLISCCAFY